MSQQPVVTCSFCNRSGADVPMVVRSQITDCVICTECIAQCAAVMADQMKAMDAELKRLRPAQP